MRRRSPRSWSSWRNGRRPRPGRTWNRSPSGAGRCGRGWRPETPSSSALRLTIKELEADVARLTDSVHQDEVARAEQRLRVTQLAERALADHGVDPAVLVAEYGPDVLVPPSPVPPGDQEDGAAVESALPVRAQGPGAPAAHRGALPVPAGGGQSAGAGGVRRAGGAARLPERADRRHQAHQDGSAGNHQGRRRPGGAGLRRGVRRHRRPVRARVRAALPRGQRPAGPDRPGRPADHRRRRGGAPAGQEGQAAVAALRRRALADRGGLPDRAVQGAAQPVLRPGRGGGRP